jgi:hypothetical protein
MFTEVLQPEPINSWANGRSERWYPPTDVDGDQDLDLFWTDGNIMQVYLNDGSGRFSEGPRFEVGVYGISRVNIVDLDEDGDLDVEVWCTFNNGYNFINDGSGSYSRSLFEKKPSPVPPIKIIIDLDNDGDKDELHYPRYASMGGEPTVYYNENGELKRRGIWNPFIGYGGNLLQHFVGDYDQDGDEDILIYSGGNNYFRSLVLYLNDGKGTFTSSPFNGLDGLNKLGPLDVVIAHMNNDEVPDVLIRGYLPRDSHECGTLEEWFLLVSNPESSGIYDPLPVYLDLPISGTRFRPGGSIIVGDFDGDGMQDVILRSSQKWKLLINNTE